jgi:membrane protease YdiL (CAAX protease family)
MLLGFLLAVGGRGRLGPIAAVVLTTLVWALLHLSMTDAPMIKLGQIAFVGLLLAALARRGGLGEAILAHLGLNVAGAATALAFAPLSAP